MGYYVDGNKQGPLPNLPTVRNVLVEDLTCDHAGIGVKIDGVKEKPIQNVRLRNVSIHSDLPLKVRYMEGLHMENAVFQ